MASSLSLPPPTNGPLVDGNAPNGSVATSNGGASSSTQDGKYVEGLIYPPPEIRSIVDKTAAFIAKNQNPTLFEDKIRQREKTDSRFSFLNAGDAYNAYYKHKVAAIKAGEGGSAVGGATPSGGLAPVGEAAKPEKATPKEPPPLDFLTDMPTINAVDLDIIRLTALFTARSGRRFTSDLAARESRNYQFDFLRPSHSLFPYFNRLVEQYTKVLIPNQETLARLERMAGGKPSPTETEVEKREREVRGRREVLKEVEERVKWERWQGEQKKQKEDEEEKERIAFGEIDWQDFVVVSTVEFTDQDQVIELPPPMSINEVESMTIAQKRLAAMRMEGKVVDEAMLEDADAADEAEADAMLAEAKRAAEAARRTAREGGVDEDDPEEAASRQQQTSEIKKVSTTVGPAGMKIRKDYVPKSKQKKAAATTLCQICGQLVPEQEIDEHVRIELLDPRWKEKKRATEANRSAANMLTVGSDVSSSLRELAKARSDIFAQNVTEEEKKRREEEAERLRKLAKEKYTWDGHMATGERITNIYQSGANLDEQIEALHRAKGLTGEAPLPTGPQIGPAVGAPPQAPAASQGDADVAPPMPAPPPSFAGGATLSAGPQPAAPRAPQMDPGRAAMLGGGPPMSLGGPMSAAGLPPIPPPNFAPVPGLPGRPNVPDFGANMPPAPGSAPPAPFRPPPGGYPGVPPATRPAEEGPDDERAAKRARTEPVAKLPDGEKYTEEQWIAMHPEPISLTIRLPVYEIKPEWGCDGTDVHVDEMPVTHFVGTLRDRLQHAKGIPIGRQQLRLDNRNLANQVTLASLNIGNGDVLYLSIKEQKKK